MASELGRTLLESRPKDSTSSPEELLVFGYSCKLFRDNEKAIFLDNGKHLIPWMGDSKLMVDRFDVRGALYDLKEAEAGGGADRWEGMTEEEKAEEERCDYERYLALYHDEYQQQAYQEEETKRLLAELGSDNYAYSQVGFSYDEQAEVAQQQTVVEEQTTEVPEEVEQTPSEPDGYFPEKDEDTFVPPSELNVPPGMVVPDTVKQNKIILKTSKFIAAQGGQMEILIKTKQAGNPMFSFLAFDHALNAFYKHTVSMIKSGRYRPADEAEQEKKRRDSEGSEGQYLHPSLSAGIKPDLTPGTSTSLHKPSADCSYSKLINQIKEKQKNNAVVEGIESPGSPSVATLTSSPITTAVPTATTSTPVTAVSTPVVATNSDSTVSVIRKKKKKGDVSGWSPEFKGLVDYPSFNQTAENNSDDEKKDEESNSNDDSSDEESVADDPLAPGKANEYSNIKWPPPDVQMVIDKMASYIIKNGEEFESMVRSRSDARFSFLKTDHEYFPYYRCKMRLYSEVYGDIFKENAEDKASSGSEAGNSKSTAAAAAAAAVMAGGTAAAVAAATGSGAKKDKRVGGKQPSTISFSIKSREQEVNLDRHSTFPVESSSTDDEDMDEEERERRRIEREERRRKRKLKEKEERERREREEKERREKLEKEKIAEKAEESSEVSDDNEDVYDIFKYAQEMDGEGESEDPNHNEKYSNGELKKSRNSHRGQNNDNSALEHPERKQQERRKKAAMFLSRLKKSGEDEAATQPVYGPQLPPEIAAQLLNSASQSLSSSSRSSRHSSSRSQSRSCSPHPGIPMPPQDSPVRPPPPPPVHSPSPVAALNYENEWGSNSEVPVIGDYGEEYTVLKGESSVLSGASEDDRRSQSVEIRSTKSRHTESSHREKARSRKKHRHERSESRSPSSRRDRKKRKRSRSRSRRHKKRRSRSRSHSKSHSKSSHKKKRRKHSSRHDRSERRSKKSRRSVSSSSSDTSELSYSSRSSSPSESEVQVIDSPSQSKRGSRASSVVSVYASDLSILSSGLPRIVEESLSVPGTPPLPPIPPSPVSSRLASVTQDKLTSDRDSAAELGNGDNDNEVEGVPKVEKKGEKKVFDPQNSAAMAKIAQGLRAKVHALLEKESKL